MLMISLLLLYGDTSCCYTMVIGACVLVLAWILG